MARPGVEIDGNDIADLSRVYDGLRPPVVGEVSVEISTPEGYALGATGRHHLVGVREAVGEGLLAEDALHAVLGAPHDDLMVGADRQDRRGDVDALVAEHLAVIVVHGDAESPAKQVGVLRVGLGGRDDLRAGCEIPRPSVLRSLAATSDYADAIGDLRHRESPSERLRDSLSDGERDDCAGTGVYAVPWGLLYNSTGRERGGHTA